MNNGKKVSENLVELISKIGEKILVKIIGIDKEAQRISISYKATLENPYEKIANKYKNDEVVEVQILNKNESGAVVKIVENNVEAFLHQNQLSWSNNNKQQLEALKKGDLLKVKIVDVSEENRKILVSKKLLDKDPLEFWSDKKIDDILTTKVVSVDKKGLIVKPEGSEMEIFIKKNQIAIQNEDARSERFTVSDRVDAAIIELSLEKRKISLSIKRVEEINNEIAIKNYSDLSSGKSLPFANLSEKLDKKGKK